MRQARALVGLFVGLFVGLGFGIESSRADQILSTSFFTGIPHTLIDFETDGSGQPVSIGAGSSLPMPGDAYSIMGVSFSPAIRWANDGGNEFDAAQAIGASPEIGIPDNNEDDFIVNVPASTQAFGFWVVNSTRASAPLELEARDAAGGTIEIVTFTGAAIDGVIGIAQYGFLGIAADVDIASVRITKDAALLDDLRFAPLPEPAGIVLVAVGALLVGTRRRAAAR